MRRALALAVLLATTATGCQFSLWAGRLEDPYELDVPPKANPTPTPTVTPSWT